WSRRDRAPDRRPLLPETAVYALLAALVISADPAPAELPPVIRSAASGPWSAPATWADGKVPGAGDRVLIRGGHRVVYDVRSEQVIRGINIAGQFSFAPDKDTRLEVGLVKVQAGDEYSEEGFECDAHASGPAAIGGLRQGLRAATAARPIAAGLTALIRLHHGAGMNPESCPAIVCCGGRMDLHGARLSRTWVKLGATAKADDATIALAEPVTGWK